MAARESGQIGAGVGVADLPTDEPTKVITGIATRTAARMVEARFIGNSFHVRVVIGSLSRRELAA